MAFTLDYEKENGAVIAGAYVRIHTILADSRLRIGDTVEQTTSAAVVLAVYGSAEARAQERPDCFKSVPLAAETVAALPLDRDEALSAVYVYLFRPGRNSKQ